MLANQFIQKTADAALKRLVGAETGLKVFKTSHYDNNGVLQDYFKISAWAKRGGKTLYAQSMEEEELEYAIECCSRSLEAKFKYFNAMTIGDEEELERAIRVQLRIRDEFEETDRYTNLSSIDKSLLAGGIIGMARDVAQALRLTNEIDLKKIEEEL